MSCTALASQLVLIVSFLLTPNVLADCRDFKQSRNYYTLSSPDEQIISTGYVCDVPKSDISPLPGQSQCNATSECPAITSGIVTTIGSNNLSLSHDDVLPLYSLIPSKTYYTPPSFLYSLSGNVTSAVTCLTAHVANGTVNDTTTAGYSTFIPTLLCIEGTLSRCSDGPVDDGTPIQLCAVNALDLGADGIVPNGVQKWIDTDVDTALNLTQNPAESQTPIEAEAGPDLENLGIPRPVGSMKFSIALLLAFSIAVAA
ncbi:CSEP0464 putative effector protein [Blumeria hordei DH14]|nr:CSEP0464 putative effector protein [Blumeria hordei DH14]